MRRSLGSRRRLLAITCSVFALIVLVTIRQNHIQASTIKLGFEPVDPSKVDLAAASCPLDANYLSLNTHGLTDEIVFHRKCIKGRRDAGVNRTVVGDVPQPLLDEGHVLNIKGDCNQWQSMPCDAVEVDVPVPFPERRYPEFLFGVATSYDRLMDSRLQFAHWLGGTGARLVAVIVDIANHEADLNRMTVAFKRYDIDLFIAGPWGTLGPNEQHFTIVHDLVHHLTAETKWIGIIDDDTFFPSMWPLVEALKFQDHRQAAYIGGLSEDVGAIERHGMLAFGGAGAFLTVPLLVELEPWIDTCVTEDSTPQGDGLLKNCIYSKTATRLTVIGGLHQVDIIGTVDGFYESGLLPVSLHHWKSWHHAPVDQMAKLTDYCGGCLLQRWRFGQDTVLSNGYTVVQYENGIGLDELGEPEGTWDNPQLYEWSLGHLRPAVPSEQKKSYYLVESERVGSYLRQVYIYNNFQYFMHGREGHSTRDEVVEIWWEW